MPSATHPLREPNWPVLPDDVPILYEDEEAEATDMGQVNLHALTNEILHVCLSYFLRERHPHMSVFTDMNCYYKKEPVRNGSQPYISADNMIVEPYEPLPENTRTYTIGLDGPEPRTMIESLSDSTAAKIDLNEKVRLYALLRVREYILVDVSGEIMPRKLLLKRLQPDGTWKDEQDPDGGVTSELGFRLIIDETGRLAVVDVATGRQYLRPLEAEEAYREAEERAEARARNLAEKKVRDAEKKILAADRKAQEEAEARKAADRKAQEEAEARKAADRKAQEEAEARRQAEERFQALQAELERLRRQTP